MTSQSHPSSVWGCRPIEPVYQLVLGLVRPPSGIQLFCPACIYLFMNYYDTLEVSRHASPEVIRAAYKSLMQRFHPDKNPGNSALAQQAGLITLAYHTLSDAGRRSAYDQTLKAAQQADIPAPRGAASRPVSARLTSQLTTRRSTFITFFWGVVLVIVVAGGFSLWLLKSNAFKSTAIQNRQASLNRSTGSTPPSSPDADMPRQTARTDLLAVRLGSSMQVLIAGNAIDPARVYTLTIPTLIVHVGYSEAGSFSRYLDQQGDTVQAQLGQRLAAAQPEELASAGGEQYLRKLILEVLADITGTDAANLAAQQRAEPSAPEAALRRYGVVAVSLPNGFAFD